MARLQRVIHCVCIHGHVGLIGRVARLQARIHCVCTDGHVDNDGWATRYHLLCVSLQIMKVISNGDDHVMAMGASFSMSADSHLVCLQNDDGSYQTQAINIQNRPRRGTFHTLLDEGDCHLRHL